jgi:MFS transporter, FSR family, fosmidomycin resistance protein
MAILHQAMPATGAGRTRVASQRRVVAVACGVHALQDGYTDLIYVLLPIWQTEFALSYAALGAVRMLCAGAMAGLQVPATLLAGRLGATTVLALGTCLSACAYLTIGVVGGGIAGGGFVLLAAALLAVGVGASTQHPLASALIARAYHGPRARGALGTYNFAGDLGKMALPATVAWLLVLMPWRHVLGLVSVLGLAVAAGILLLLPRSTGRTMVPVSHAAALPGGAASPRPGPFLLLLAIGVLDSGTRMGFLAFLPFVLRGKGAETPTIGLALTLIFAGGAAGKLVCGLLGARLGVLRTVLLTEVATALGIFALAPLPLAGALACLPLIGVALNGTSSVLYGTVPELVVPARRERAFGLFYTGTIGGGAVAPVLYGLVGDAIGPAHAIMVVALVCLATLPLAWALNPSLQAAAPDARSNGVIGKGGIGPACAREGASRSRQLSSSVSQ